MAGRSTLCASSRGRLLGEGAYGAVYELCEGNECGHSAVKEMGYARQSDIASSIAREIYYNQILSTTDVTPGLEEARVSGDFAELVFRQCRPLLDELEERGLVPDGRVVLEKAELDRMAEIANVLGQFGVVHGDLQLSQFLVRCQGSPGPAGQLYLSDFGLAFDAKVFRLAMADWYTQKRGPDGGGLLCALRRVDTDMIFSSAHATVCFNLWLLEQDLAGSALVRDGPGGALRNIGRLFEDNALREQFESWCPDAVRPAEVEPRAVTDDDDDDWMNATYD